MPDSRHAALALIVSALVSGPASAQSLGAAYRAALTRDPEWLSAREDAAASGEGDAQARALFLPKVAAIGGGGYSQTKVDVTLPPPVQNIDRLSRSGGAVYGLVTAQQPLLNGQASAQARQLRAGVKAGAAQLEGTRQQLMLRVAEAYFSVLAAREERDSFAAQEASARREQRAAQARFDVGRAKITDVREAQARGDGAAAQRIEADGRVDTATARYAELTGLDGSSVVPLRPDIVPVLPAGSLTDWQRRGETASPAVTARGYAADAASAHVGEYSWKSRVRVDAMAGAASVRFPRIGENLASIDRIGGYSVGVRLQVPLYTGGALESQRRQAAAQARSAREQVDMARRDVRLNVQQAWTVQSGSVAGIAALRTAVASARLQEKAAITGREVGVRTQSDVLMAQAQVIESERRLGDALRGYERSRLSLYAAAGELDEQRLNDIDRDLVRP
ncbi:TolC family outer membrane protein [Sphingomonas sp. GB1N7]|uniref:TolC family outer membrane protein n=1 Tax=Parasphingomonas caseinilytica TaxID=3096158 RepID=UPI002FCAACE3